MLVRVIQVLSRPAFVWDRHLMAEYLEYADAAGL